MIHLSVYAPIDWLKGHQIEWTSALTFGVCTGTAVQSIVQIPAPNNFVLVVFCNKLHLFVLFQQARLVRPSKNPYGTKAQDGGGCNFPLKNSWTSSGTICYLCSVNFSFWTRLNTATVSTQGLVGSTIHQKGIGVVLFQEATGLWPKQRKWSWWWVWDRRNWEIVSGYKTTQRK